MAENDSPNIYFSMLTAANAKEIAVEMNTASAAIKHEKSYAVRVGCDAIAHHWSLYQSSNAHFVYNPLLQSSCNITKIKLKFPLKNTGCSSQVINEKTSYYSYLLVVKKL